MTILYYKSQLPKCRLSLDSHCGPFTPTFRNGLSWQQHGGQSAKLPDSKARYSSPSHLMSHLYPQVTSWRSREKPGLSLPTSPSLALPDEEGPSRVSRQQQQFFSFLPAQALIQPPAGGTERGQPGCGWAKTLLRPLLPLWASEFHLYLGLQGPPSFVLVLAPEATEDNLMGSAPVFSAWRPHSQVARRLGEGGMITDAYHCPAPLALLR